MFLLVSTLLLGTDANACACLRSAVYMGGVLQSADYIWSPFTIHVAPNGNQNFTGLNEFYPLASIQEGVKRYVAKNIGNQQEVVIQLADGSYNERVLFSGITCEDGARVILRGNLANPGAVVIIPDDDPSIGVLVDNSSNRIYLEGITVSGFEYGVVTRDHSTVQLESVVATNNYGPGIRFGNLSHGFIYGSVLSHNNGTWGLIATNNSNVHVYGGETFGASASFSNNGKSGIMATTGGTIEFRSHIEGGTTWQYVTVDGNQEYGILCSKNATTVVAQTASIQITNNTLWGAYANIAGVISGCVYPTFDGNGSGTFTADPTAVAQ